MPQSKVGEQAEVAGGGGQAVTDSRPDRSEHTNLLGHSKLFKEKNNTRVSVRVKEANEEKADEQCLADGMHSTPIHYYHYCYCAE